MGCQHYSQVVTLFPMESYCKVFEDFIRYSQFVVGDEARIRFLGRLVVGDQPLSSQFLVY